MRRMTIEAAIVWAVRDELPKVGRAERMALAQAPARPASPAARDAGHGALGALIDARPNRYGVTPDLAVRDGVAPHADAITIGDALLALDAAAPAGFGEWDAFEDIGLAGPLMDRARSDAQARASAMAAMTGRLSALMVQRAVLGPPQGWRLDGPVVERQVMERGKPVWVRSALRPSQWNAAGEAVAWTEQIVDGYDARRARPFPDAWRLTELHPDPLEVALARAEWQLWRAALDVVQEDVAGRLHAITTTPSALPWRPWVEGMPAGPRVLSGGAQMAAERTPERPVAGRPLGDWWPQTAPPLSGARGRGRITTRAKRPTGPKEAAAGG